MKTYPNTLAEVFAAMAYLKAMANDQPFVFQKTTHSLGLLPLLPK